MSLRSMLDASNSNSSLPRNMSSDSMGQGMVGLGAASGSTFDLNNLLRSGSNLDLGAELYEDSLLTLPHSDSIQSLDQMVLGGLERGSSNNLANLEMLAGRQQHTAHTMDRRWEW